MSAIAFARWAVADALKAAASIAGRACETFDGTDEAVLFANLRDAIDVLRQEGPEMKAIMRVAYLPPVIPGQGEAGVTHGSEDALRQDGPQMKAVLRAAYPASAMAEQGALRDPSSMAGKVKLSAKEISAMRDFKRAVAQNQGWGTRRIVSMQALEQAGLVKRIEHNGMIADFRLTPAGEAWEDPTP